MSENLALGFDVSSTRQGDYWHLEVRVWQQQQWAPSGTMELTGITLTWQANVKGDDAGNWYANRLNVEDADAEKLALAGRILRRIGDRRADPLAAVAVLRKMATEGVHDGRVYRFRPLAEIEGPEYKCYMAWGAPTADGYGRNLASVLATSAEAARPLLVAAVAGCLASTRDPDQRQRYVDWIADPQAEVREQESYLRSTPDARPAEDKIALKPAEYALA